MRCRKCGAFVYEDQEVRRETSGARTRLVCLVGHSIYVARTDSRGRPIILDHPARLRPRPGSQAQHIGRRVDNKTARWHERTVKKGRCPHCGKPCQPYRACEARRRYKRLWQREKAAGLA